MWFSGRNKRLYPSLRSLIQFMFKTITYIPKQTKLQVKFYIYYDICIPIPLVLFTVLERERELQSLNSMNNTSYHHGTSQSQ